MARRFVPVALLLSSILGACTALPFVGAESGDGPTSTPEATRLVDTDGPFLHTDAPRPTYDFKTARATPARSEWELPDCYESEVSVDVYPQVEKLVSMSSAIIIATFAGYGEPRWSTTSGERPTTEEYVESDYVVTIVRDVQFDVDEFLRGTDVELSGAYVRGGELGCDRFSFSNLPDLAIGDRAVYFVGPLPVAGPGSEQAPLLMRVWWIRESGALEPYDGPGVGTLEELTQLIEETPFSPHVPFASPMETGGPQ